MQPRRQEVDRFVDAFIEVKDHLDGKRWNPPPDRNAYIAFAGTRATDRP